MMKKILLFLLGMFFMAETALAGLDPKDFFESEEALELIELIEDSNLDAIRDFNSKGGDINVQGLQDSRPITWAIKQGKKDVVHLLIELGVELDYPTETGGTPLTVAAAENNFDLVDKLLALGATPNVEYDFGVRKPLFAELLQHGNEKMAKHLLSNGADIDFQISHSGETAMIVFYRIGDWKQIFWLLDNGADPYIKDEFGYDLDKAIQRMLTGKRKIGFFQKRWFKKVQKFMDSK
jgi:ankyrin repeat protein